jgi:microsomal prostaglandin-E synthase 2
MQSALSWSKGYKKVPIAIINGEAVPDSNAIIDRIEELLGVRDGHGGVAGVGAAPASEQLQWRSWVDERLVRLLTVCIYRTWGESAQASDYITQRNFSRLVSYPAKWAGTGLMYVIARRMKSKYSFPEDVRTALCSDLDAFVAAIGPDRPFLGGSVPCGADVTVFGALRAVRGLDTLQYALEHSKVEPWFRRMEAAVGGSALEHRVGEACVVQQPSNTA